MHPADEIRGEKSWDLKDKRIALCITGSIAAIESFHLCRELIRHGADVIPVMSETSTKILHPNTMEFASGRKPVLELGGQVEHVKICRNVDLILIAPCTANTISKIATGVADNALTSCVLVAEGSGVPILIAPAMHLSMYESPIMKEHVDNLRKRGFTIIDPEIKGEGARLAGKEKIIAYVKRTLNGKHLKGKRVLVIGGASIEYIDDIRFISNRSSGKMAISLATKAFEMGADVELWHGMVTERMPDYIPSRKFESVKDVFRIIERSKNFDFIIVCAALANYVPDKFDGKLPSNKDSLTIKLRKSPYVIEELRKLNPNGKVIAFKAEKERKDIEKKALDFLNKFNLDLVVANTLQAFGSEESEVWIVSRRETFYLKGNKKTLAEKILLKLREL